MNKDSIAFGKQVFGKGNFDSSVGRVAVDCEAELF